MSLFILGFVVGAAVIAVGVCFFLHYILKEYP